VKRLIAVFAAALVVVVGLAAGALARERPAEMERMAAASGALAHTNSAAGGAVITAHGLMPGQATSGTLTLGNTGEAAGLLVLARTSIHDQPGPYAGRLSDVLTLLIEDISKTTPREVFYGEVGGLERVALDALPGGEQRTYRSTVEFPDTGPGGADNEYMGSSVRFDYQWRAAALPLPPSATPTPGPGKNPPPGGSGGPVDPGPGPQGEAPNGPSRAPFIYLKVPHQRVIHTDAVRLYARCSARCKVRFSGRAQTAPRGKRAKRKPLLRRGLFRGEHTRRKVGTRKQKQLKLKLTRRGRAVLRRELDTKARVGVVIRARVKGRHGTRTVKRRIVLHTTLIRDGKRISGR
jgi:spore coat-associated protein N